MNDTGIPSFGAQAKKASSLPTPMHAAPRPKRILSAASASTINSSIPHPAKSAIKSKVASSIVPPKSLLQALKPKTAGARVPKPTPVPRHRPSTTPKTPAPQKPVAQKQDSQKQAPPIQSSEAAALTAVFSADINKSLSLAQELISIQKNREVQLESQVTSLQNEKTQLEQTRTTLQEKVSTLENNAHTLVLKVNELEHTAQLAEGKQTYENELRIRDLTHDHETKMASLRNEFKEELAAILEKCKTEANDRVAREQAEMKLSLTKKEKEYKISIERERQAHETAVKNLKSLYSQKEVAFESTKLQFEKDVHRLENETVDLKAKMRSMEDDLTNTKADNSKYQSEAENTYYSYQVQIKNLQLQVRHQTDTIQQLESDLEVTRQERSQAKEKLFQAEAARRKLHGQIQDLKGNIRVFCRVRPVLGDEKMPVELSFPDMDEEGQQIQLITPNSNGMPSDSESPNKVNSFAFDKVFNPQSTNEHVFEEVSQLVQSALDGYNVCIFAYGQTGSGKTFTMSSHTNGIIPLAISQIFETSKSLKEIGWEYEYHGEFLEIYNERIVDLLNSDDAEKKLEIRHDPLQRNTTVTGLTSVPLSNASQAASVLEKASKNRSVATTSANERSSRSHSVFILRLTGYNKISRKTSSGVLNLIDLAGSERLSHSQVTGDRLKETQAINKSLSSLGDVICALGNAKDGSHVPYRNSKVRLKSILLNTSTNKSIANVPAAILALGKLENFNAG